MLRNVIESWRKEIDTIKIYLNLIGHIYFVYSFILHISILTPSPMLVLMLERNVWWISLNLRDITQLVSWRSKAWHVTLHAFLVQSKVLSGNSLWVIDYSLSIHVICFNMLLSIYFQAYKYNYFKLVSKPLFGYTYAGAVEYSKGHRLSCIANSVPMRPALFWDITRRRVVIVYRRFGIAYRSHLQGSTVRGEKSADLINIAAEALNKKLCTV
jgi:hypothetical protein